MAANSSQILLGTAVTTAFHPIAYTKILMQMAPYEVCGVAYLVVHYIILAKLSMTVLLGYEPLPLEEKTSIFGSKVLCYPSAFQYIGHIKRTDGFLGLYRGLGARLIGGVMGSVVTNHMQTHLKGSSKPEASELDGEEETVLCQLKQVCCETAIETVARCCGVVASQPFHVVMVRSMAQFVGRESGYDTFISGFLEVYSKDGILGYFSGIIPRLLGEIATIWLANLAAFLVNTYLVPHGPQGTKEVSNYTNALCSLLVTQVTYPFSLVSNIMTVSNSGLAAGEPPVMPFYNGWTDCWTQLTLQKQLKRGSSLFFRYYKGPCITAGGVLRPAPL